MITETCVIHPRLLLGAGRAGAAVSTAEAARRSRSSPELGAWAPRVRQGLRDLAHRGQGARAVLTEVRNGRSCSGAGPTSRSGGGSGVEVADWSQGWCSGLWIFTVRLAVVLRSDTVGQGCSGLTGGVQKGRRKTYPRRGGLCSDSGSTGGAA